MMITGPSVSRLSIAVVGIIACLSLVACSGSESGGGGAASVATPITGTFVDSPVNGLHYTSVPSNPAGGMTANGGQYQCVEGDTVTFDLGGRVIGTGQPCGELVTVVSVFGATSVTDIRVRNLAQLLLTLGGIPAGQNPIDLPATLPASLPAHLNFSDPQFEQRLQTALPGQTLVSQDQAAAHLRASFTTLTVTAVNGGQITSIPAGLVCTTGTCSYDFVRGTPVTLAAIGTGFTGWNGDGCTGAGTCQILLTATQAVRAVFLPPSSPPPVLGGGGTLTITGAPASIGGTFVASIVSSSRDVQLGLGIVTAAEPHPTRGEGLTVTFEFDTGILASTGVVFVTSEGSSWGCTGTYIGPGMYLPSGTCAGVTVDRVAGIVSFVDAVLTDLVGFRGPITINGTLTFTPMTGISIATLSPLAAGIVNQAYNVTLTTLGGTQPFTWSLVSGTLPAGLTLNPTTGQIAGTPTTEGTSTFTIQVRDSAAPQQSRQKQFNLTVNSGSSGGGMGIVTITGGPQSLEASFVPTEAVGGRVPLIFREVSGQSIDEVLEVFFDETGVFRLTLYDWSLIRIWRCDACSGATLDRTEGTVIFENVTLPSANTGGVPITLNGTLTFEPF